jgi:hypothetical protein
MEEMKTKAGGSNKKGRFACIMVPIVGFLSLLWFLIRVIPKPSRAAYPCQRAAFPLASAFVIWITGMLGSLAFVNILKKHSHQLFVALSCLVLMVSIVYNCNDNKKSPEPAAVSSEQVNTPMGTARGIHPGRVVWAYDADAANWDGSTGDWWDNKNTNQAVIDKMFSASLKSLTSAADDKAAWDMLFHSFNVSRGRGDSGYTSGEKIVIKINENNQNNPYAEEDKSIDALPQTVLTILRQLINVCGVRQSDIYVIDALRPISDPVYNLCHGEFRKVNYLGGHGYPNDIIHTNIVWKSGVVSYSNGKVSDPDTMKVPEVVLAADYLINLAILKSHDAEAGVTLCGKNYFGLIGNPESLHPYADSDYNSYAPQVDLLGHHDLGGKTMLFIIDGIYGSRSPRGYGSAPRRWDSKPFNGDWPSSIFISQDPVAVDSVGFDFLKEECKVLLGDADNYLHEAALADNPGSGVVYDPEGDGTRLAGLGCHEHWNNPVDKQYSRNLDPAAGRGIELVAVKQ